MKKILSVMLCLALMCVFAVGEETVVNPMAQVNTLAEVIDACGCSLMHPAVMGVMDEGYFVITLADTVIGEYRYSLAGTLYTLRAARFSAYDISGVFIKGAPAFDAPSEGIEYAHNEKMRLARWFIADAQYVLTAEGEYVPDEDTFSSAVEEMALLTGNMMNEKAEEAYDAFAGFYQDSVSQRAMLVCERSEDGLKLIVTWANSAFETVQWIMNAQLNESGQLSYSDCRKALLSADTEEVVYTEGCGYFTISDGKLIWDGAADENCRECVFEKLI